MKKYLIALIFALIIFPFMFQTIKVSATSNDYLRVITEDTPFFTDVNSSTPLFYIPYTYYVKTIGNSGEFTHVEVYGSGQTVALDGFVPTDMLFNDGLYVTNPFVMQSITTAT